MIEILRRLVLAAERREHIMGDVCSLLSAKAELADAVQEAKKFIQSQKISREEPS